MGCGDPGSLICFHDLDRLWRVSERYHQRHLCKNLVYWKGKIGRTETLVKTSIISVKHLIIWMADTRLLQKTIDQIVSLEKNSS